MTQRQEVRFKVYPKQEHQQEEGTFSLLNSLISLKEMEHMTQPPINIQSKTQELIY